MLHNKHACAAELEVQIASFRAD